MKFLQSAFIKKVISGEGMKTSITIHFTRGTVTVLFVEQHMSTPQLRSEMGT